MKNETFVEETIKVIRPTNKNKIFNEEDYDVIQTYDRDQVKLVILREKIT